MSRTFNTGSFDYIQSMGEMDRRGDRIPLISEAELLEQASAKELDAMNAQEQVSKEFKKPEEK
jgi:hypothetical protein